MLKASYLVIFAVCVLYAETAFGANIKWCVFTDEEEAKCAKLNASLRGAGISHTLVCVRQSDALNCMNAIGKVNPTANLMRMDAGLAYYSSQLYALRPVVAENYGDSNVGTSSDRRIEFKTHVLVRRNSGVTVANMRDARLCSSGVGTADGWTVPLARLIQQTKVIPVQQCNSVVLTLTNYFGGMCLPGALNSLFNNFGSNPQSACSLCKDTNDGTKFCRFSDFYAGSDGALRCMQANTGDVAFLRLDEALAYAGELGVSLDAYELLCPDGSRQEVASDGCSWGTVPSPIVVASIRDSALTLEGYRAFLNEVASKLGPTSTIFNVFNSTGYGSSRRNLMFSDQTRLFYHSSQDSSPAQRSLLSTYNWLGPDYLAKHDQVSHCPLSDLRWCVLSSNELEKCEKMKLAFSAKNLKPTVNCVQGSSAIKCMDYIRLGLADVMSVDAGDLYVAGNRFGLVPFVAEFYGDGTDYYAVAIVRQTDKQVLVSNLKHRRTCHSGIGKATGWVVPMNLVMDTRQITVVNCRLMHAFSELVSRACVPGVMQSEYNPSGFNPINLCENCAAGGRERCMRTDRELYYGDNGAFRCLVEGAGDVAFARHTTVLDNTAGHNPTHWARNRRSDDFELLCPDGSRRPVKDWATCNLGTMPGNVLVTAGHKSEQQKQTMWQLLQYAMTFYASDDNGNGFQMFSSGFDRSDLLFQDIAESLVYIPAEKQNYKAWLGQAFLQKVRTIEWQSCGIHSGMATAASGLLPSGCVLTACLLAAIVGLLRQL